MQKAFSKLGEGLQKGEFIFTGELEPEKSTSLDDVIREAFELRDYVVACNVTDNPASFGYMSSLAASYLVQERAEMEVVYQLRCADRNRLALLSDLLGAAALGIKNILALTGDYVGIGDFPDAKPVYDYDSAQLTHMIRTMVDKQEDPNGNKIHGPSPEFHVGVAANPRGGELEALKILRKVEAGAEFIQTQVIYELESTLEFIEILKDIGVDIPVLVGVFPMRSYGVAKGFDMYVPGVSVPKEILEKLEYVKKNVQDEKEKKEQYDQVNLDFFGPLCKELKKSGLCAGIHIMSVHYTRLTPKLLEIMG